MERWKQIIGQRDKRALLRLEIGAFVTEDMPAIEMAAEDLRLYWNRIFRCMEPDNGIEETRGGMILFLGNRENHPGIRQMEEGGRIPRANISNEGFVIDIFIVDGIRTAVLRTNDRLGAQYALYGLAEHYLGARFIHPFYDLLPDNPPMPEALHIEECPAFPLRILYETSHVVEGLRATVAKKSHYSDIGAWRWEDWAGNPERMKHFIVWGIKNRVNVAFFDDTIFIGVKKNKPFILSEQLWKYMDLRGLKTMMYVGPSWAQKVEEGYLPEDFCNHEGEHVGHWSRHLCIRKDAFWHEIDLWLKLVAPYRHRLAGLFTNWNETPCGMGASEGAEDHHIHSLSRSPVDLASSRIRNPVLSHGSGCTSCGDLTNAEKWNMLIDYLKGPQGSEKWGLPPIGHHRCNWAVAEPDDAIVAERVVPHLPHGSINPVYSLPNCNSAERMEGWPRIMDEVNAADGGDRKVILVRELNYGCQGDMPLVHITSLDRIDDDHRVFGKYKSTATVCGGSYILHSMGWLLTLYSMRKQWEDQESWKIWTREYFRDLLDVDALEKIIWIAEAIKDVQLMEGIEKGEYASYYSIWGLDLNRIAPEMFPHTGPLKPVLSYEASTPGAVTKFARLVAKGSRDTEGLYTPARCEPVERRLHAMAEKLQAVFDKIHALEHRTAAGRDAYFWHENVLLPFRWTADFLMSRILVALSYCSYIWLRDLSLKHDDPGFYAQQGEERVREALAYQDEYIRLRLGFAADYPDEMNPAALRIMQKRWRMLQADPQKACGHCICALLDDVEQEAEDAAF